MRLLTFVNGGASNMVEHKSGVNIIDELQHLKEVEVFIKCDALQPTNQRHLAS